MIPFLRKENKNGRVEHPYMREENEYLREENKYLREENEYLRGNVDDYVAEIRRLHNENKKTEIRATKSVKRHKELVETVKNIDERI